MVLSLIGMSMAPDYRHPGSGGILGWDRGRHSRHHPQPGRRGAQSGSKIGCDELVALLLMRRRGRYDSREHHRPPGAVRMAQACWLLLPLPLGLVAAFALLRFPALVAESETTGRTPLRHLLRERWSLGALAAIFLGGATELGMAQWRPPMLKRPLGYPQWVAGWLTVVLGGYGRGTNSSEPSANGLILLW